VEETIKAQLGEMGMQENFQMPKLAFKGKGCATCSGSGYRGRFGIFEVLEVDEGVRDIIVSRDFKLESLRDAMQNAGGMTMFQDGLKKVELGLTTIEEVVRIAGRC